jgi:hypothetical protein
MLGDVRMVYEQRQLSCNAEGCSGGAGAGPGQQLQRNGAWSGAAVFVLVGLQLNATDV